MLVRHIRLPFVQMLTWGLLPSWLKVVLYRLKGARIGHRVKIGWGSVIVGAQSIEIGDDSSIGMFTAIVCTRLEIGKRSVIRPFVLIQAEQVAIGDDVVISETALIRASIPSRESRIVIGDRVHIFPFSMIDPSQEVEVGAESSVGYGTYIFTHGAYKSKLNGYPVTFGEVHIGKGVWIPSRVFIMPSVTIGDDAVIGTGALVNHDIPSGALAVGLPAKVIKSKEQFVSAYSDEEKIRILVEILTEFCRYLQDYAGIVYRCRNETGWPIWELSMPARGKVKVYVLALLPAPVDVKREWMSVILDEVPDDLQEAWDAEKRIWFSIGSRRCSQYLDDLGEELREFLKRYGLYFARP